VILYLPSVPVAILGLAFGLGGREWATERIKTWSGKT